MERNVGQTDKIIRAILGVCLIGAGVYFNSWWGALGVVPLLTAAMGMCPIYSVFGISSCKK